MSSPDQRGPVARQSWWQFSLLTLLVATTWVAVACTALRTPSPLWSLIVLSVALLALLFAVLAIVYRSGRTRAFAVGFVTFGTGFLAVVVFEQFREGSSGGHQMPTTSIAASLFSLFHGDASPSVATVNSVPVLATTPFSPTLPSPPYPDPASDPFGSPPPIVPSPQFSVSFSPAAMRGAASFECFLDVVHSVLLVPLGIVGGIIAQILYATRRENSNS